MTAVDQRRAAVDHPSRRVLMVLFHFPPIGGVPVPRNVRNVQYLPGFGWTPVVVAPRRTAGLMDVDGLQQVPSDARIVRSRSIEADDLRPLVMLVRRIASLTRSGRAAATDPGRAGPGPTATGRASPDTGALSPAPSLMLRIQRLLFFPDNQVGWLVFALVAAVREHRSRHVDVVYSTSAPFTAHLVGGLFKRMTGVPWVAEFRDPWVGNPVTEAVTGRLPWLHRRLQARVERWIVHSADRLVFVSPSTARLYRRRYPNAAPMVVITNGHDRSEVITRPPSTPRSHRYRIVWTGTLDRPAELEILLEAVASLATRRPELPAEMEIVFYGTVSDACHSVADRYVRERGLGPMLQLKGRVSRQRALEALADADAALVMLGAGPGMGQFVPGKLFECLGQSQQVLAILPPGDARQILEELRWGVIADPEVADVERAVERLLTLPAPDRIADPDGLYDRRRLVGRLADTLCDAATSRPGAPPARTASPAGEAAP